jgi:hypothetical protein
MSTPMPGAPESQHKSPGKKFFSSKISIFSIGYHYPMRNAHKNTSLVKTYQGILHS